MRPPVSLCFSLRRLMSNTSLSSAAEFASLRTAASRTNDQCLTLYRTVLPIGNSNHDIASRLGKPVAVFPGPLTNLQVGIKIISVTLRVQATNQQ